MPKAREFLPDAAIDGLWRVDQHTISAATFLAGSYDAENERGS